MNIIKSLLIIFSIVTIAAVSSLILYDQYESNLESQVGQIDLNEEYCNELMEQNRSGITLDKQQREEMRNGLEQCQQDLEDARPFDKLFFSGCEDFKKRYDGKMHTIHGSKVLEWAKLVMADCKK